MIVSTTTDTKNTLGSPVAANSVKEASAPDTTILKLTLATAVALLLAGVAVLVSANTNLPASSASLTILNLSGKAVNQSAYHRHLGSASRTALVNPTLTDTDATSTPASTTTPRQINLSPAALGAEKLKQKALNVLRSLPDYNLVDVPMSPLAHSVAIASHANRKGYVDRSVLFKRSDINVNTFLLSTRISNESRLAELQMQPFFMEFDSRLFDATTFSETENSHSVKPFVGQMLATLGFPHIETNKRPDAQRYKPYKQLVSFNANENGEIVPHIKCMGLSPKRVAIRAKQYEADIIKLALKHNVSASLVKAVIAKESCYNAKARSHVGAIGLMQLMPETAKWLKVKQPENPAQNLAAGVKYLAQLRKRFGSNELALAAYNAGPGNVERYNGIPPFAETQNYVQDVMHFYRGYVETTRFVNAQNDFE